MTAQYPNNVATDADLLTGVNNWQTGLNGAMGASGDNTGGSGIALVTTVGLPTAGVVTIEDEAVYYSGISGNNLTGYIRGFDDTIATSHTGGKNAGVEFIAMHHNALKDEIIAIENDLITGIRLNAYENLLINPGFEIWQRGIFFTSPANGVYTADRWFMNYVGTPTFTVSQNTAAPLLNLGKYSLQCALTSVGASSSFSVRQSIENYQDFIGKQVSLSIWVNSSVPGVKAFITNGTIATSLSAAHAGGSAFQRLTCTYTVPAGSTALYVGVGFVDIAPTLSTIYLDSGNLVFGAQAVDYQPSRIADDVDRCLRYYEKSDGVGNQGAASLMALGSSDGTYYLLGKNVDFSTQKSGIPTVTVTVLRVQEEGSGTDLKAGYSTYWDFVGKNAFRFWVQKAIGGNKPNVVSAHWTAEMT